MLWTCLECTTRYALDLQACPNCGSTEREESDVPKITTHGGPTNADEEKECPGNDSSTSSDSQPPTPETSESVPQKPARKTARPSKKATTESSAAPGTDGSGRTATSSKGQGSDGD